MDAKERGGIINDALDTKGAEPSYYQEKARRLVKMPEKSLVSFITFVLIDRDKLQAAHNELCDGLQQMLEAHPR